MSVGHEILKTLSEWDVVLVFVTLIGMIKIFTDISKEWTNSIARLDVTVKNLQDTINKLYGKSHDVHKRIFDRLDEHEEELDDHDKRILILEKTSELEKSMKNESKDKR